MLWSGLSVSQVWRGFTATVAACIFTITTGCSSISTRMGELPIVRSGGQRSHPDQRASQTAHDEERRRGQSFVSHEGIAVMALQSRGEQ
jgi:hypothetical protein